MRLRGRLAAATAACVLATGLSTAPVAADAGVGAGAFLAVNGHELDAGFVQTLQSTLDSQFVGIRVAVVRDRLVLEGYASPGVHRAVLAIVGDLLQNPVPVPIGVGLIAPGLGRGLPYLDTGLEVEIPDLSPLLGVLGVVDNIRIAR